MKTREVKLKQTKKVKAFNKVLKKASKLEKHNKIHQTGWKEGYKKGLNDAIKIFRKLPEDEVMTKHPVILELTVLRDHE